MSYCRWSSDDCQCDVYVYAADLGGFAIHVASNRRTPPTETRPAPVGDWWSRGAQGLAELRARDKAVDAWLNSVERKPIGLEFDGQSFYEESPSACASRLEQLKGLGYKVPQSVIDLLREEAEAETK